MSPRKELFLLPPPRSKSEPSMCRELHEMGGGVDAVHCCALVLKPGNSWSQQSVHHFIHGRQDEQLDSCWDPGDAASSSGSKLQWGAMSSNGSYFEDKFDLLHCSCPTSSFTSRYTDPSGGFWKGGILQLCFRKTGGTLEPLPRSKCAAFSIWKEPQMLHDTSVVILSAH